MTTKKAKKSEVKRPSLADFNFKAIHERGGEMKIITPNGSDSGATLTVRGPDCDESIMANRVYTRAILATEDHLSGLKQHAEASQNWYEYNTAKHDMMIDINADFVCSIVTGWTIEDEFSIDALRELLMNYPALIDQVSEFHAKARETLAEK